MPSTAALIYPHQLYADHSAIAASDCVVFVEDPLFFRQYRFHRQKLLLHRASMRRFAATLRKRGYPIHYLEAPTLLHSTAIGEHLKRWNIRRVRVIDPNDDYLQRRLHRGCHEQAIPVEVLDDQNFLTPLKVIDQFASGRNKLFFTDFYIRQRKRLNLLLDGDKPVGGQWSFDPENRKRLPRSIQIPAEPEPPGEDEVVREARTYVRQHFPDALGNDQPFLYPTDHETAKHWLERFLRERLPLFGDYEDAISQHHRVLFHSVLTPILNIGLLTPAEVVTAATRFANQIPVNSLEGFIRQVIGWREFVRLVYRRHGGRQRSRNFWGFSRPMPDSFYTGRTGILPVDHVIRQVLQSGYCHHIERLMILGNFMLLCEIDPDAVYRWFMELFVDAYDWVMVPNVYGMSQHADGGLMTTKPYLSSSSYILKMSDFPRGDWCAVWDALYWRFIDRHSAFFARNPRMAVMVKQKDRLGPRLEHHHRVAEEFLQKLHGSDNGSR